MTNRAQQVAEHSAKKAARLTRDRRDSPQVRLNRILKQACTVENLNPAAFDQGQKAIFIDQIWDCYAKVLYQHGDYPFNTDTAIVGDVVKDDEGLVHTVGTASHDAEEAYNGTDQQGFNVMEAAWG